MVNSRLCEVGSIACLGLDLPPCTTKNSPLFDPPQPSHITSKSYGAIRKHASDKEPTRVGANMSYLRYGSWLTANRASSTTAFSANSLHVEIDDQKCI